MNQTIAESRYPAEYLTIDAATKEAGFTMASEALTGALLRTLAASKPKAAFLELGTGTGLSTAWILDGMDGDSTLTSVDNDANVLNIARNHLGQDGRLTLVCEDGEKWLLANTDKQYDYVFADTWHGKYLLLEEAIALLKPGGLYIIDDMLPQANWPDGHAEKADKLVAHLESRTDLVITKQNWASGIIIGVKK